MKLGVVGSRDIIDYKFVRDFLLKINEIERITCIVSGGARGIDSLAEKFAEEYNFAKKIFYADWDKNGKAAGFMRNTEIVDYADLIVAFWDGKSNGTKDTIEKAKKQNKLMGIKIWNK